MNENAKISIGAYIFAFNHFSALLECIKDLKISPTQNGRVHKVDNFKAILFFDRCLRTKPSFFSSSNQHRPDLCDSLVCLFFFCMDLAVSTNKNDKNLYFLFWYLQSTGFFPLEDRFRAHHHLTDLLRLFGSGGGEGAIPQRIRSICV